MPTIVELPDKGVELEFPDGMSDEEMRSAILKEYPEAPTKQFYPTDPGAQIQATLESASRNLAALTPKQRAEMEKPLIALPDLTPWQLKAAQAIGIPGAETLGKIMSTEQKKMEGLTSPLNLGLAATAIAAPPLGAGLFAAQGVAALPQSIQETATAAKSGDVAGTITGAADVAMNVAAPFIPAMEIAQGFRTPRPPIIPLPQSMETVRALPGGEAGAPTERIPSASEIIPPTEIHGSLRSFPEQSLRQMPVEEGGSGIQPQAERGLPKKEAQASVAPQIEPQAVGSTAQPMTPVRQIALDELKRQGWNPKWPFVQADLLNKSFRDAIRSDPTLSAKEKAKILSFGPKDEPTPTPKVEPADAPTPALTEAGAPEAGKASEARPSNEVRIAELKQKLAKEQKALDKNIAKMGSMVPPPIVAEVTRKIGTRMAKIQDEIDALEAKPTVPAQATEKVQAEVKAVSKTEGARSAKGLFDSSTLESRTTSEKQEAWQDWFKENAVSETPELLIPDTGKAKNRLGETVSTARIPTSVFKTKSGRLFTVEQHPNGDFYAKPFSVEKATPPTPPQRGAVRGSGSGVTWPRRCRQRRTGHLLRYPAAF